MVNGKGNGHGDYNPSKEYEYLDADVWIEKNSETGEKGVAYTEDVEKDINQTDSEDDSDSDSETKPNNQN
ncbi:MAG: hypothetical protein QNJ38_01295 [Prochloraceae cyanobacterium]|nr:hypothetical protein [Prochloraceae cyanobacterium]